MSPEMIAGTGIVRGIVAGVLLVAFVALWFWCYSARRRPMFDAAARMPLEDDNYGAPSCCGGGGLRNDQHAKCAGEPRGETR